MGKLGLVISGGGRNGAFAAGALWHLVAERGLSFEAVSGTSTGALLAGPALLGRVELLADLYAGGLDERDVLAPRGLLRGFLAGAFAGTEPLQRLIEAYLDLPSLGVAWPRRIVVSCVNLRTGRLVTRSSAPDHRHDLHRYVLASASIPLLMDLVMIDGDPHADGGLVELLPVQPLLAQGLGLDLILAISNYRGEVPELPKGRPLSMKDTLLRVIDVMTTEIGRGDLPDECEGVPLLHLQPRFDLGPALDFDREEMVEIWRHGVDVAREAATGARL